MSCSSGEKGDSHQIWVILIANHAWPGRHAAPGADAPVTGNTRRKRPTAGGIRVVPPAAAFLRGRGSSTCGIRIVPVRLPRGVTGRRPADGILCLGVLAMNHSPDIRWQQRFENFDRALSLLKDALSRGPSALNQLEKEGAVQRFEYTLELAWKTVKDYLEQSGVVLSAVTPRQVIKDAFAARILDDGQTWIDMIDHRNLLSHTYDAAKFEEAVDAIHGRYLAAFAQVRDLLGARKDT